MMEGLVYHHLQGGTRESIKEDYYGNLRIKNPIRFTFFVSFVGILLGSILFFGGGYLWEIAMKML